MENAAATTTTTRSVCGVCIQRTATGSCGVCALPVCNAQCMRADWANDNDDGDSGESSTHRALCAWMGRLSIQGKRERGAFQSTLHYTGPNKTHQQQKVADPYARMLNPTVASNDVWLRRFAQLDRATIEDAIATSASFRYYFASNARFWYWVRQYHPTTTTV